MALFALLFLLFFVVLVVCGTLVHAYLYANGAFNEENVKRGKMPPLSVVSFSQTATIPTSAAASDLYYGGIGVQNEDRASIYVRRFILYTLVTLLTFVVLTVLVLSATQF